MESQSREPEVQPNAAPLTVDTFHVQHIADDEPSSANNFITESPTATLGTYPAPTQPIDTEKVEVEDEPRPAPIFTASAPKLSLSRRGTTSYQKQTFRMESGINPAETIAERLEAWRVVLKNLAKFFKEISAAHTLVAKGYTKGASLIEIPFHDSGLHFREEGGIQTVWAASREYALDQSKHHHDYSLFLDKSIIHGLRMIKREVKTMNHTINSDDRLKTEPLYRYRQQAEILQTRLSKYIQLVNTSPEHANEKTDPYIVSACLNEQMNRLYREENRLHDSMLNLQREYAIFERKIVESTRNVLKSLQEYRTEDKFISDHVVQSIMEAFNKLEPDSELKVFLERRQCELVSDNAAYKDLNDITHPNQKNPLVIPCKVGYLERKTFVTKNWVEHKYVLTPSGFLHEYKTEKDFPCHPEVTIFLPQTTVVSKSTSMHHDYIFEVRGRKSSKGMLMKTLERDKTYAFRTRTGEEMQTWMDLMTPFVHQFRPSVPYEPEPYMQPINSTNADIISRSSTWGSEAPDNDLTQPSSYENQQQHLADTSESGEAAVSASSANMKTEQEPHTAITSTSHMDQAAAGVSDISLEPEKVQEISESEKTEAIDQHNPFADHAAISYPETKVTATVAGNTQRADQPNPIEGKIPVNLYDQSEAAPKSQAQENQKMPGSFMV